MLIMWLALLPTLALATYALWGWRQRGDVRDLRYGLALLAWGALLLAGQLGHLGAAPEVVRAATRVAYQLTILGVAAFLMTWMRGLDRAIRLVMGLQVTLGLLLAFLHAAVLPTGWGQAWFWFNALSVTALVASMARVVWRRSDAESWMVLLVALLGLGVVLVDLHQAGDGPVAISVSHYFYALALFVLWLALTQRVKRAAAPADVLPADRLQRQLAQELHDGVGSELTTLISALDAGSPEQRATAARLRHCMLELKLLVDGISEEGSVLSHLASLRYRMQPLLAAAGFELHWHIDDEDELERAQGPGARQVLRVAQEALANAVSHSQGNALTVHCRHLQDPNALLLEVRDNGKGMVYERYARHADSGQEPPAGRGKGLSGMVLRAQALGGHLMVDSGPGEGTCVRLQVPMAALLRPATDRRQRSE